MRTNAYGTVCAECGRELAPGEGVRVGFGDDGITMCAAHRPVPPPRSAHEGWHTAQLASLDFETTGVDPFNDRILSYAALADIGVDLVGYVNPGVSIPPSSAEIHGITQADIAAAPDSYRAVSQILEWIGDLVWREVGLVVYNASYDLTMLRAEADRLGLPQPAWHELLVVDPFIIDWGIERGRLGSRRLTDVAQYYGVAIPNAHDATCDARAAREVAVELGARHPDTVAATLPMLMAQQRYWSAARSMDWNRFALRKGRRMEDPGGWPFSMADMAS